MKNSIKALFALALIAFFGTSELSAQRISALANISNYSPNNITQGGTNVAYQPCSRSERRESPQSRRSSTI